MKIALIYYRENYTPAPPIGILYIGTVLEKEGHEVIVVDSFPAINDVNVEKICDFQPDLIGLSVLTTGHQIAVKYTNILKRRLKSALLCWGGVHATSIPVQILEQEKEVDFVVVGEGEQTMSEVCNALSLSKDLKALKGIKGVMYRDNGVLIDNGPRAFIGDLNTIPIPNRELLKTPAYSWYLSPPGIIRGQFLKGITTIYASRGCPYHCIFCCSHEVAGRKYRLRSVDNVLEEIRYLKKEFNIKGVYFNDDTFGIHKPWVYEFCERLNKEDYKLVWGVQTRAHLIENKMLSAMKSAGCMQVDIGCESGSNKVLKNLKKGIKVEHILNAFQCAKEVGMDTYCTFILGNPGETIEDIKETERIAKIINSRVSFLIMVPYPGSEMFDMAKENDWLLDKDLHFSENWTNKQSENPVMEINFNSKELLRMRADLQNYFFWKNNFKIMLYLLIYPLHIFTIFSSFIKFPRILFKSLLVSINEKKPSIFIEDVYQKYNEGLMNSHWK